ncbi:hypothetical protein [Macrococcus brunensis]|nr:hypothetical protein [Macrococcus brunensis]ULG74467.1 hypothetical protein MGG13_01445 [Macrococcus brunensis]
MLNFIQHIIDFIVFIGDKSVMRSCYFYFNEDELDARLYEEKRLNH